jgi:hypothetical protein
MYCTVDLCNPSVLGSAVNECDIRLLEIIFNYKKQPNLNDHLYALALLVT